MIEVEWCKMSARPFGGYLDESKKSSSVEAGSRDDAAMWHISSRGGRKASSRVCARELRRCSDRRVVIGSAEVTTKALALGYLSIYRPRHFLVVV